MRLASCFAALLLVALGSPSSAAPARTVASRNLLSNPGFERALEGHEWMPAGWDTTESGLSTVFFGRDSFLVHSGRWSVNVANTSALIRMGHNWNQTLLVGREAWGKDAVFTVWTRNNGLQGRAYVLLQAYRDTVSKMARIWAVDRDEARRRMGVQRLDDPLFDLGWKREQFSEPQTDWVRRELRVYVPPSANVLFVRCGLFGTGQLLIDDASLTLEPAKPVAPAAIGQNLFADPDFEGDANGWEYVIPPYEGSRIDPDSSFVHAGRTSVRCWNGNEGIVQTRMGVCQPIDGRLVAGRRVRLSAWIKGDSLYSRAYLAIFAHTQAASTSTPGREMYSETFDWTHASIEFDVPKDAVLIWPWVTYSVPCRGTLWIDDTRFEVIGAATTPAPKVPPKPAAKPAAKSSRPPGP